MTEPRLLEASGLGWLDHHPLYRAFIEVAMELAEQERAA
jgi:hypothetical protein